MSDTVEIVLNDATWTLIAAGAAKGFITNEGIVKVKYREDTVLPTDDVGHTLEMEVGAYINYNMLAGQNVYMKTVKGTTPIAVTPE